MVKPLYNPLIKLGNTDDQVVPMQRERKTKNTREYLVQIYATEREISHCVYVFLILAPRCLIP